MSNGAHDTLYLIMDFNPLHEPGQGNQGLRACNGYRYEFHIGTGASLKDQVVYRVEFTNRLANEAPPSPGDPVGGGNELLWQLTGGTETMKVTRITQGMEDRQEVLGTLCQSSPITMARRPIGSFTASVRSRAINPVIRRVGKSDSTTRRSSTGTSIRSRTAGVSSLVSSTIGTSSTRRASSTS